MNIIGKRNTFLVSSGLIVLISIALVAIFGFKLGIDFGSGTIWQLKFSNPPQVSEVRDFFERELKKEAVVTEGGGAEFFVRFGNITEEEHKKYFSKISNKFGGTEELSFWSTAPLISGELRKNSMIAVALVLAAISLYVAFAFRKVSKPISSWQYGVITLVTLFHDIAIPAGVFAWFSRYYNAEVDTTFIVALLVIMGFSVHDTIVVFDRIRENLLRNQGKSDLKFVVNKSINETLVRSLNTSFTLIIVLVGLLVLGPETLRYFILTMLIGVTAGTYSSIFLASPLLTVWYDLKAKGLKKV